MQEYIYIIVPMLTIVMAQIIKFTIESFQSKKLEWARLFNGSGGMPSTHTSSSFSLVMTVGYKEGFTSSIFAVALIFCFIVSYDAMGVRYESGKQAQLINEILKDLDRKDFKALKEKVGHKPFEVIMGYVLGFITSTILVNII